MAVVKLSGVVTEIVGKMGGTVFQNSAYGTIAKNNRYKRSRQRPISYKRRAILAYLARYTRTINDAGRTTLAANGALFTRPTKQGPATPYNWYSWFMAFNYNLLLVGQPLVISSVTPTPEPEWSDFAIGDESGSLNWSMTGVSEVSSDWYYIIEASAPVPAGAAFRSGRMQIIQTGESPEADVSILRTNYTNIFGPISSGQYVWFRVSWVKFNTGERTQARITKADAQ